MEWIRYGDAGPAVEDVQRRLAEVGLACADDSGVFGDSTRSAVRAFQQSNGLTADGDVGDDTWYALVGASFRLGDRLLYPTQPPLHGHDVQELQRRLNLLGFDCGFDDGVYGDHTADAVRDFQLNVGMAVDGIAGPQTCAQVSSLHRHHQQASVSMVRERQALQRPGRGHLAGARIMVDPAHSVTDPGFQTLDGTAEHDIAWRIASRVDGRLTALGAHVVFSRGPRSSPSASARARHANTELVDLILSIHLNADRSPHARGAAAYYFGTDTFISERGRALAELAVDGIVATTGTAHCRVHPSTSALLRESRAPAVIVEVGFATHPEDGHLLTSSEGQRCIADALVDAVVAYITAGASAATRSSAAALAGLKQRDSSPS
ncbi:MAG: peptidoglycan-binding protein [Nitriliruptoraceae bacterium]